MKKILLSATLFLCVALTYISQKYENGIFTTQMRNGNGSKTEMTFKVTPQALDSVKAEILNSSTKDTSAVGIANSLNFKIIMACLKTESQLKAKSSLWFEEGTDGDIYIGYTRSDLVITFVLLAKNGYGNEVSMTSTTNSKLTFLKE